MLGGLAGILAAIAASILNAVLATAVFDLNYQFNILIPVIGILAGALGVALVGTLGARSAINTPPVKTLREGG